MTGYDLLFTLDIFFMMIVMCPGENSKRFMYDPVMEMEFYEEEREIDENATI